ncbi:Hypothetical protein GLP15_3463 [Giardia lamblia P15]|uniref:Uncharacterized protein n=1 Tax=Giardia intestinalis (strain P15) TaxID=658858 RepID=E1F0D4_GIAIA|nr:Hypothetical protein GLP15_3463 [Giardia lamblia P15]
MSCACRQQPVETYGYSTDIWSMTPQLKLSTASGPVEITYEDGVWSCTNSADPDIQKLHDSASQLERQKKHLEDKLRSIEEECRKKERAIEVILGSKKCTTVPRRKTPVFTAARNGNHTEKTLFSEVRSSATLL